MADNYLSPRDFYPVHYFVKPSKIFLEKNLNHPQFFIVTVLTIHVVHGYILEATWFSMLSDNPWQNFFWAILNAKNNKAFFVLLFFFQVLLCYKSDQVVIYKTMTRRHYKAKLSCLVYTSMANSPIIFSLGTPVFSPCLLYQQIHFPKTTKWLNAMS